MVTGCAVFVEQNAVRRRPDAVDRRMRANPPDSFHKMRIDQRVAHNGRQADRAAANAYKVGEGLFEHTITREFGLTLLELERTKHAIGIAEIGELKVKLEGTQGHCLQRGRKRPQAALQSIRFPCENPRNLVKEKPVQSRHLLT